MFLIKTYSFQFQQIAGATLSTRTPDIVAFFTSDNKLKYFVHTAVTISAVGTSHIPLFVMQDITNPGEVANKFSLFFFFSFGNDQFLKINPKNRVFKAGEYEKSLMLVISETGVLEKYYELPITKEKSNFMTLKGYFLYFSQFLIEHFLNFLAFQ